MIDSGARPGGGQPASAEQMLDARTQPLPHLAMRGQGAANRIAVLLERAMTLAGAADGVVVVADDAGQLTVRHAHGLADAADDVGATVLADIPFGLTVRAASLGESVPPRQSETPSERPAATTSPPGATDSHCMVLWLPLDASGRLFGGIRLGFAEFQSLEPSRLQRLGLMADHVALALEVEQLARESAARGAEVERVSAELAQVDRLKGEFLSMISHELRTPLTAIIGYTDLLLREIHGPLNERQALHQGAVKKAAHRLLALINDLLDVNRLESGQIVLHLEAISLHDAVRRATTDVTEAAERRGVGLRLNLPAGLVVVTADPERLHQILLNLLDNALKFTPKDGTVTVHVDRHGKTATVSVIDTGIGVQQEQLDRVWNRFHQADSSSRRHYGGTGLGLAIVRHLVERHGGCVAVSSPGSGQGSTFAFTLPVAPAAERPTPDADPASDGAGVAARHHDADRKTVLIVDDEPDNREVVRSIIEDVLGLATITADNGLAALDRAQDGPDLILLDLRMPGLSGFEVARRLKAAPATAAIPILAITALNEHNDLDAARAAGCLGCITKPFTNEALAQEISNALATVGAGDDR
ncbi:MAG: response regulator [Chloroflexi bacterium]|nr:response regulator [Chloroflexota bacterium]